MWGKDVAGTVISWNHGKSGTHCSHSHSRNDYSYSDNRNPHSHHYSHSQTKGHQPPRPYNFSIFQSNAFFVAPWAEFCSPSKSAQAEPIVRSRRRGTIIRIQITETRIRTRMRRRRQKGTIPSRCTPTWIIYTGIEVVAIAFVACSTYLFGKGIALSGMSHRKHISISSWEFSNSFISGWYGSCAVRVRSELSRLKLWKSRLQK